MHIPDGFIDGPTSLAAAAVAIGAVAWCLRSTAATLGDREVPLVGLVAAFVFAGQMLNFPVVNGTSGHFLGGVLAAVLVGPAAGALAMTVVVGVQALLFADGGLSALGLNVVNLAVVGSLGGYTLFRLLYRVVGTIGRPRTPDGSKRALVLAAGIAAALTTVAASVAFTIQYAVGGNGAAPVGAVAVAMTGVHAVIGLGEGVITAMALSAVVTSRPDLVFALGGPGGAPPTAGAGATP